ncbi:hypothetical protein [Actinoplanes sp. NPDC051411]|uniref:hypothetical protein n=1 Tax=Actinoplanes sp. NPDC051411 TaxID=3155522 RepID=UPI00341F7841
MGKESTTVVGILIHEAAEGRQTVLNGGNCGIMDSPKLPHRLEPNSPAAFTIDAESFSGDRALVYISLGHEERLEGVALLHKHEIELTPSSRTHFGSDIVY